MENKKICDYRNYKQIKLPVFLNRTAQAGALPLLIRRNDPAQNYASWILLLNHGVQIIIYYFKFLSTFTGILILKIYPKKNPYYQKINNKNLIFFCKKWFLTIY